MADPANDPGIQLFGVLNLIMMISAGGAAMSSARNFRLFIGAAIIAGLFLINLFLQKELSVSSSTAFGLDALCAVGFYFLSKPTVMQSSAESLRNDWASYVCGIYIFIIALEFIYVLIANEFAFRQAIIALILVFVGVVFWGGIRGFGIKFGAIFFLIIISLIFSTVYRFYLTLNLLTIAQILIVTVYSLIAVERNIRKKLPSNNHPL